MRRISTTTASMLALGGALLLAGCNKQPAATDNAAMDNMAMTNADDMAMDNSTMPADDNAVVEDESVAPPVQVVQVPAPAPATPAAEAAPLTDAVAIEQAIAAGTGIERVRQSDGWAWMRNGQIIRTASTDGRRVSYFRGGQTTPYFVQDNGQSYAYSNGQISHQYDDHGHATAPDAQHKRDAQQLADQARQQHDSAQQASRNAPHDNGHGQPAGHGQPTSPAPTGSHAPPQQGHAGNGQQPGVHPTPAPSGHGGRSGSRDTNGHGSSTKDNGHQKDTHGQPTRDANSNEMAPQH